MRLQEPRTNIETTLPKLHFTTTFQFQFQFSQCGEPDSRYNLRFTSSQTYTQAPLGKVPTVLNEEDLRLCHFNQVCSCGITYRRQGPDTDRGNSSRSIGEGCEARKGIVVDSAEEIIAWFILQKKYVTGPETPTLPRRFHKKSKGPAGENPSSQPKEGLCSGGTSEGKVCWPKSHFSQCTFVARREVPNNCKGEQRTKRITKDCNHMKEMHLQESTEPKTWTS